MKRSERAKRRLTEGKPMRELDDGYGEDNTDPPSLRVEHARFEGTRCASSSRGVWRGIYDVVVVFFPRPFQFIRTSSMFASQSRRVGGDE